MKSLGRTHRRSRSPFVAYYLGVLLALSAATVLLTTCQLDQLISPPPAGTLTASPEALTDSSPLGSTQPLVIGLSLSNPGARQQSWTASQAMGATWLAVDPKSGTAPSDVNLTLNPNRLSLGSHRDTLVFSGGSGSTEPTRVPIEFVIHPCLVTSITPDTALADSVTAADCEAPHRSDHFAKLFQFDASAGDSITIRMESAGFDAHLVLDSMVENTVPLLREDDTCQGEDGDPCLRYVLLPASGTYFIEATTVQAGATGAFNLDVRPPRAPRQATGLVQALSDSVTAVALGATVNDTVFVFKGAVSDLDLADSLRLEIEIQPVDLAFTGLPSDSSELGADGDTLVIAVVGFADDTRFHWRARTTDQTGRSSAWVSFGGNGETEADFAVAVQEVPGSPSGAAQFRSDATTPIAVGGATPEATVVISGTVNDPDPTDLVRLEVEMRPLGIDFSNAPTGSSVLMSSGNEAIATITGLTDNTSYHWQVRTVDQDGATSSWVPFGGNAETEADFSVTVPGQPDVPTAANQLRGDSTTGILVGETIDDAVVVFSAVLTDPDPGDQVRLEVELRPTTENFNGLATAASPLVTNGSMALIRMTNVGDDTDYHWRLRAVDGGGAAGPWVSFGGNPDGDVDFGVAVPASQIAFVTQPGNTEAGTVMTPPVVVTAREPSGQTDTAFTQTVSLAITPGTGAAGAVLSGTLTVQAVGGVASFSDLRIDLAGIGYTLTAATTGLAQVVSSEFDVIAAGSNRLALSTQPSASARVAVPFDQQPVVQVVDANGNPVSQAGVDITAEIESGPAGASLGSPSATTDAAGQATFSGLALTGPTGSYTLRFGATGLFPVSSNPVALELGDADPARSTAVVPGGQAGAATSITIQARDAGNNDLTSGGATVVVSVEAGPNADSVVTVVDNGDGTYTATYTPTIVGTDSFSITLDGTGIGGGPYTSTVVPGPADAAQTSATVPSGTAGFVTVIDIQARDEFGNDLTASGGIVAVSVTTGPNTGATVTVVDNGDGTYEASYTPQMAGTDNFEISLNSVVIGGGPYTSDVTASDASADQTTATVPATGTAGVVTTIVVQTRDVNGNDLTTGGETVGVVVAGANALAPVDVVDNNDGTYTATYTPTTAGPDDFNITLNGTTIGGGPYGSVVGPGPVSAPQSTATVPPGNAGSVTTIVVQARDAFGNNLTTGGSVVAATVTGENAAAVVTVVDNLDGTYTGTYTPVTTGTDSLTITLDAIEIGGSPYTSVVTAGGAVQLGFLVEPADVVAGVQLVDVQVAVQDAAGNTVPTAAASITLALGNNPAGGMLSGQTTINTIMGVATFSGLSIDKSGAGYTLVATSAPALTQATSVAFNVTPGTATQLAFTQQPTTTVAGEVIPAVTVTALDAYANVDTAYTTAIGLTIGNNPGGGTLTGGDAVAAASGVATFSNLSIDGAGIGYTLQATSGALTQTSASFDITPGAAAQLAFVVQPNNTLAGQVISPPVQVVIQDTLGNVVTSAVDAITVAIGTNPSAGVLSGTPTVNAVNGTATFSDLSIATAGDGYTLTADGAGLPQVVSTAFNIEVGSGNQLSFFVQPVSTPFGSTIPEIQVEIQDQVGNRVTTATDSISLLIQSNPSGGLLSGTTAVEAVAGLATFSDLQINQSGVGYTLIALGTGLSNTVSSAFDITPAATTTTIAANTPNPSTVGQGVVVNYSVTSTAGTPTGDVTVTDGVDSCAATVAAGTCTITITTEGARTLTATYAGAANYATSSGTAAQQVNAVPAVTLAATPLTVAEAAGASILTATLSVQSGQDVTVTLGLTGTAALTTDYTLSTTSIVILAGATTGTATLTAVQDALDELDETVIVDISDVTNGTEDGTQQQTITITDDDTAPTVTLEAAPLAIPEAAGVSTLTATLSAVSGQDVTVTLAPTGTATQTADYTLSTSSIVIPAGSPSGTATLTAVQDLVDETNETVIVDISAVTNGTENGTQQQTITITDDDAAPTVSILAAPLAIAEAAGVSTITATLSAASEQAVTVTLGFTGTATDATDYTASATQIIIPALSTTGTATLTAVDDILDEANETIIVDITTVTNATEDGVQQQTVTITDDDAAPDVTITADVLTIPEAAGVSTVTATLSAVSGQDVTVTLAFAGTATNGTDYTPAPAADIVISAGATTGTATVTAVQDALDEQDETVIVDVSAVTNGTESGTQQQTITITDDDDPPSLSIDDVTVTEGNTGSTVNAVFTVTLSAVSGQQVTVAYTTTDGTAVAPADYTTNSGTLTFAAGVTQQQVTVVVQGDDLDEGASENFTVDLSGETNATISDAQGVGTITDDDGAPTLSINDVTVAEGASGSTVNAVFTVTLSAASGQQVTVGYTTTNGTAIAPDDYTANSGTLTFAAGVTQQQVTVVVQGDDLDEGTSENFTVDLSGATNATISDTQGVGTITDDDAAPSLSIDDVTVTEGNTGSTVNAVFTVTLSAQSGQQVTVGYTTTDGTAVASADYTTNSGTLTFAAGVTQQQVTVVVQGDDLDEGASENFTVDLSGETNATISDAQGIGTITDDDDPPSLSIDDVTVTEGNSGSTVNAVFTVTLSAVSAQQVTVNYATANGTATAPGDYTTNSGTLTFPAGVTQQQVTVVVNGDNLDEGASETFTVDLSGATNATIADAQGIGTITDDDNAPSVTLFASPASIAENAGTSTVTAVLSTVSGLAVTVNLDFTGTATVIDDYTTNGTSISIPAGTTTGTVTVTGVDDALDEQNETIIIDIGSVTNATESGTQQQTITILDDDPTPSLSIDDVTVTEGNGGSTVNAVFTVTLSAQSGQQVMVDYTTTDGTAVAPGDYTANSNTLTFAPGVTQQQVTVVVQGDDIDEGASENFTVNLSGETNATISDAQGIGTITDDDDPTTIASLDVSTGSEVGGTAVTITGTGFNGATGVTFGGTAGTEFLVVNPTTITVRTPAGTGTVDVVVLHPGGDATLPGGFTYTP
jgi:hypothetical protein